MCKNLCSFLLLISICSSSLTLQQYPEYEVETPQVIFQPILQSLQENHPQISKLVFITPWNQEGKRLTIKYAHKIKYVSPCWYELIVKNGRIVFQNDHLKDQKYIKQLKSANVNVKIIPRIYVNNFQVFRQIGTRIDHFKAVLKLLKKIVIQNGFDGIVWDSPYNLFVDEQQMTPLSNLIHDFVNELKKTLKSQDMNKQLLLMFNIANPSKRKLSNTLYQSLDIDALLIQNYDSPLDFIQMINNSVEWLKQAKIYKKEIIMMLPFFSYKNGNGISTIDAKRQLENDGIYSYGFERGMCRFLSKKKFKYLVPCFNYFSKAYKILEREKFSAGFWEGGNGLENYYVFM